MFRVASLVATLVVFGGSPANLTQTMRVGAESIEVFDQPDESGFETDTIPAGERVFVRRYGPEGWASILPPDRGLSWIESDDFEEVDDLRGRVTSPFAAIRPGREGARLPGPPHATLPRGAIVQLLDLRPLVVRQSQASRRFRAIKPPRDEIRYVRASGLVPDDDVRDGDDRSKDSLPAVSALGITPEDRRRSKPVAIRVGSVDHHFGDVRPDGPEPTLDPMFRKELARAETIHRRQLNLPLDRWNLEPARKAYRELLDQNPGTAETQAVQDRLDQADRQDAVARSTRTLEELLRKSRDRDREVESLRQRVAQAGEVDKPSYDARGLLQSSSKLFDGRRAYALINDEGYLDSYLMIPPGLPIAPLLTRQVGVMGTTRFIEGQRARVIQVRDIEAVGPKP